MQVDLAQVLKELAFQFGPAASVMLQTYIETGNKVKSFVGIDAPWIIAWCEQRKAI